AMQNTLSAEATLLHAELCAALADPKRILLLYAIHERPRSVTALAQEVGISQPAASRHLKVLRDRGLVRAVRTGQSVEYHITDSRLIDTLDTLRDILRSRASYRANILDETQEQP
ncbi:MAG: ArsR family transcriptional regulator, partial [Anaerolineae bacterium]